MRKRVVITGMGAVTPLGHDLPTTWAGVTAGKSGVRRITHFDPSGFPSQIAGEVKNFDFSPTAKRDPRLAPAMLNTQFAITACEEAVRDSGLSLDNTDPLRRACYFAAGDSAVPVSGLARAFFDSFQKTPDGFDVKDYLKIRAAAGGGIAEEEKEPAATLRHLVRHFRIGGPASNSLTACAASAQAIGEASEIIRRGEADVCLSGGAHSMIHPFGVAGFCLLTTLSMNNDAPETASRPFDETRSGFVLSEGAAAVVLEEYEHAKKRGARIYGELLGYGSTADAYRLTDSHPEAVGASAAILQAVREAGIRLDQVDYLNAHGTSTKVNDAVETLAIKKAFGDHAYKLAVSSTKSMTGHLIAAAGAVELEFCLLAMRDGIVPPTINYRHKDPDCDLDYVPNEARRKEVRIAASNSFGFGGQNIVLIVGKV
jgi:3-oxoacyl-[acyl-carrier-protein] synthase II